MRLERSNMPEQNQEERILAGSVKRSKSSDAFIEEDFVERWSEVFGIDYKNVLVGEVYPPKTKISTGSSTEQTPGEEPEIVTTKITVFAIQSNFLDIFDTPSSKDGLQATIARSQAITAKPLKRAA